MTSDELLKRLDDGPFNTGPTANLHKPWHEIDSEMQHAADRIRELEAERDEAVTQMIEAKVELETARLELSLVEHHLKEVVPLLAETHVIVPVEPTEAMGEIGIQAATACHFKGADKHDVFCIYRAMIRAAQPDPKPKQGE